MNNKTLPELPDSQYRGGNDVFGKEFPLYTADQMRQYARDYAASQTAGVPDGWKLVPVEPTEAMCDAMRISVGDGIAMKPVYRAMLAAAPAASGGEDVGRADCGACPKPIGCKVGQCRHGLDNTPESRAPQLPAAASVSERARVSLDLNNLPAEWPWDEGSPCLDPRPVGMVYPAVPTPRAFGYLDKTGVEWAAYDTGQMEEYGRRAFADGANTALRALEQALTQQRGAEACAAGYAVAEAFLASYNSHCTDPAPNLYHDENGVQFGHDDWGRQISVPNPRCRNLTESEYVMTAVRLALLTALAPIESTTTQPSADAVRELVQRWRDEAGQLLEDHGGDRAAVCVADAMQSMTDELESLLSAASGEKGVG